MRRDIFARCRRWKCLGGGVSPPSRPSFEFDGSGGHKLAFVDLGPISSSWHRYLVLCLLRRRGVVDERGRVRDSANHWARRVQGGLS
eukprot:3272209-Pyramimonas_sp.AAC.1